MRADPALTARTAGVLLDAARELSQSTGRELSTLEQLAPDLAAPWSRAFAVAQLAVVRAADALVTDLAAVLEADADRLYQVAFSLRSAEGRSSARAQRGTA